MSRGARKYVIDASAWVEYLIGSRAGEKVRSVLDAENSEIYTCAVTVAEVVSKTAREGQDFEVAYDVLTSNSQVVCVDEGISKDAGLLHSKMRETEKEFGLADAYLLAIARKLGAMVLTGDLHFKGVREAVFIK